MKKLLVLLLFVVWPALYVTAQVSINTTGNPPVSSAMLDITSTTGGLLIPRMTEGQIEAIFNPADGLQVYCTTDGILYIFVALDNSWKEIAFGDRELFPPSPYTIGTGGSCSNTVIHGTYVIDVPLNSSNYVTIQVNVSVPGPYNITTSIINGYSFSASGDFTITGLQNVNLPGSGTPVNATFDGFYATGSSGGGTCQFSINVLSWICGMPLTINHLTTEGVAPVDKTVTYGTVTGIPGEPAKCWITSNLGADHQANAVNDATEASAGWYWQFNRKQGYKHDGTSVTPAWTITSIDENSDWTAANDPCTIALGSNWRIPTSAEWMNVDAGGNWTNWLGPWASALKLHVAGYLRNTNGSLDLRGLIGHNWSSTQISGTNASFMYFQASSSNIDNTSKAHGFSLRCIKE